MLSDATIQAGIGLEHDKRLVSVHETDDGITATFADGTTASADVLVGADGIHSTVRRLIDSNAPQPQPDGLLGFGGDLEAHLSGRSDAINFVFGKRAFLGYWLQPNGRTSWREECGRPFSGCRSGSFSVRKAIGLSPSFSAISSIALSSASMPAASPGARIDPATSQFIRTMSW